MSRRVERSKSGAWDRWFIGRTDTGNERRVGGGRRGRRATTFTETAVATDSTGKPRTAVKATKISGESRVSGWWFK